MANQETLSLIPTDYFLDNAAIVVKLTAPHRPCSTHVFGQNRRILHHRVKVGDIAIITYLLPDFGGRYIDGRLLIYYMHFFNSIFKHM